MVYTAEGMKAIETRSVELGLSWLRLMENAGSAAAKVIRDNFDLKDKKTVIVTGKGNNGGDGYVIARKLNEANASVKVISIGTPSTESSAEMFSKAYNLGIKPIDFDSYESLCCQYIKDADIVIDSIFGTGFKGTPRGNFATAISAINCSDGTKIAIDVPSGMYSDSGTTGELFVKADMTVTFAGYKPCHLLFPSAEFCGKIHVVSIGMPKEAFSAAQPVMQIVTDQSVAKALPQRKLSANKGDCGKAGLFCGSYGMAGAAVIAGKAAVKSGVGIANMIIPESIYSIIGVSLPEAVCTLLNDGDPTGINDKLTEAVTDALDKCNVGLIGCGLGQSRQTKYTVHEIMKNCSIPLVLDADGINILSNSIDLIKQYTNDVVITPHPKEASRLLNCSVEEVQRDRLGSAERLATECNAVVVLKGANTIIALPDGSNYVVTDGNPGMATAGTGDMLAGMITAFLAQGLSAADAAVCGVKLHAMAGDLALEQSHMLSLTPTDMIDILPYVLRRLEK